MDSEYDLFQVLADGTLLWRETVAGQEAAMEKLEQLADNTVIATTSARKTDAPTAAGA